MKSSKHGLLVGGALLAIACGDTESDAPPIRCDASASSCSSGGSAGVGGTGGASGQGGSGATSGRGGAGGSSGAAGTGTNGSGGTTSSDAGGQAGSSGSGGSAGRDAATDLDASRSDASDAASDAIGRRCLEPTRVQDGGSCTVASCRRGSTVEISVSRPEGWYVGALFWVLTVCDISFAQSRGPSNPTLIYDVSDADWASMREGDPLFMYYGPPGTSSAGVPCGQLTKNIPNCAP